MTLWLNHTIDERIVKHRSIYYAVGYVDYSKLIPSEIDFVPRQELMKDWEGDYAEMCNHFIYGQTLSFEKLLERIKELQDRFRKAFLRLFLLNIAVDSLMSIKIAVGKACEKKKSSNSLHM